MMEELVPDCGRAHEVSRGGGWVRVGRRERKLGTGTNEREKRTDC
jgi:hypothetical protein